MRGSEQAVPPGTSSTRQGPAVQTDPIWASARPGVVSHVGGASPLTAMPEDSKRNWTVKFPPMGLRRGEVTKWEEWLIMTLIAVQAAGMEARKTWDCAMDGACVAYKEYQWVDKAIRYNIQPIRKPAS